MAPEREGELKVMLIPDVACRAGCQATWGLGNQLFIYGSSGDPEAVKPLPPGLMPNGPSIHEVRWDVEMQGPITRKLVNETHNVFLKVQKNVPETMGKTGSNPQLVKFSREYRSVIKACVMDMHRRLRNHMEEDQSTVKADIQHFEMIGLVWNLCEILFIDPQPGGVVITQLLDWVRWHFREPEQMAHIIAQEDRPQDHMDYWNVIYSLLLQGRRDQVRQLFAMHPARNSDSFCSMDELLRTMPLYQTFTGQTLAEFDMKWRHWQDECQKRMQAGEFTADNDLNTMCRVLCGEDQVFLDLFDLFDSWYSMLVSRIFFQNPATKAFDLQYSTQFCIDAFGGNSRLHSWDHILLATLEFDVHEVIKECSTCHNNWWFVAHLTDLLHHCGKLETQTLYFGSNLREFLLLEYASSLMSHCSLWQVGIDYLDFCPQFGRPYMEQYIEHIPIESERKAHKILRLCEQKEMTTQARSICKTMGMKSMHNGRLGSALSWAMRSQDVGFITFLAEKLLNEYIETGDFLNLDLIDNLGASMLISTKLTFLGKYREFHQLYKDGDFHAAAALLLGLLTARMAPKRFWLTLLTDALPLLESDEVIFSSQQTYELMYCLEELRISQRLEQIKDSKNTTKSTQTQTGKTQASRTSQGGDFEKEKLELMKLALARNLARAIVHEGSTKA